MKEIPALFITLCMFLGICALEQAEEQTELCIMWWGSQTRRDKAIAAHNMYMEENPNIKITYELMGFSDYRKWNEFLQGRYFI